MNKTLVMLGCIGLFLISSSVVDAQILSPTAYLDGEVSQDTMALFIGKTDFSGGFHGYPADSMIDTSSLEDILNDSLVKNIIKDIFDPSLLEDLHVFPLLSSCYFKDIDRVTIVDAKSLESISTENILDIANNIEQFSNVNIIAKDGPFLFGTAQDGITIESKMDFAISSVIDFEFEAGNKTPFLTIITESPMTMRYPGESSLLFQPSDSGSMMIEDLNGNEIWNKNSSDKIFFIEDDNLSFIQSPPIHILPITSRQPKEIASLHVSPAESRFVDITKLLDAVKDSAVVSEYLNIQDLYNNIQGFDTLISAASSITNGGMILVKTNDTFTVDNSPQTFSGFGFARGNGFDVKISEGQIPKETIAGDYKLIFLGDHFYTSEAKDSKNGVAFPFLVVFFWAFAIGLYFLFRFYIKKKEINEKLNKKIKKYALIFHIIALITAFILMDREISFQFGISAIDAILGQGISLIFAGFIALELAMWTLGYLILGIPTRIITDYGLKLFGIGKDGRGIGKGVGALFIWFFCAIYVKLIINLIFLIVNPTSFLPMG